MIKNILSFIRRLLGKRDVPASPAQQTSIAHVAQEAAQQKLNPLERDLQRHRDTSLSTMERYHLNLELSKRYSRAALEKLLEILGDLPPMPTKQEALRQVQDACQVISDTFPLTWGIDLKAVKEFGDTSRYMLNAHFLWLNPNGAYCIFDRRQPEIIFTKAGADGAMFAEPQDFDKG